MDAVRANFVVGDEFQDVRGAQLGNSAAEIGKWSVWKPLAVQRVQGCLGVWTGAGVG